MSINVAWDLSVAAFAAFYFGVSLPEVAPFVPDLKETVGSPSVKLDGTAYAGVSPDTYRPMYTTPKDAPLTYTFDQAASACAGLDAHGQRDWRVPTKAELNVLFQNRAAIGGFDTTGSDPAGWYWSSSRNSYGLAWAQRFSDGGQDLNGRLSASALRCVRG